MKKIFNNFSEIIMLLLILMLCVIWIKYNKLLNEKINQQRAFIEKLHKQENINISLSSQIERLANERKIKYIYIKESVMDYSLHGANSSDLLESEFVFLLNRSIDPDAQSASIAHETTKSNALDTLTKNFEICNEYKEQINGWQLWYNQFSK